MKNLKIVFSICIALAVAFYFAGCSDKDDDDKYLALLTPTGTGTGTGTGSGWTPPIGIPIPEFGIEETYRTYDTPANRNPALTYTQNAEGGFYTHYIEHTHPAATDTANSYGNASRPRNTIPWDLPAGSVAEVHGGPYTDGGQPYGNYWTWFSGTGTIARPVFIRGTAGEIPVFIGMSLRVGGSYIVIENFDFNNTTIGLRTDMRTCDHISFRNLEVHNGPPTFSTAIYAREGTHVVIYNNYIHDNGDPNWHTENDFHGVSGGDRYIWVVDNHMHGNGGDSVQINSGTVLADVARYIYIGRNLMHEEGENAVDLKGCADVIVSENIIYGFGWGALVSGGAPGIRVNDEGAQENIWILFNHVYNNKNYCIAPYGSDSPPYIIGNIIHDSDVGITSGTTAVVNNVIYNVGTGIVQGNKVVNNIIYKATSYHLDGGTDVHHNLLWEDGNPVLTRNVTLTDCMEADPLFVNAAISDFHLQPTSPAIDNGTLSDVYQTFFNLYGIDITKDLDGNPRPRGADYDIGAYETP